MLSGKSLECHNTMTQPIQGTNNMYMSTRVQAFAVSATIEQ